MFRNFFHTGYVVLSIDKAIETAKAKFGVGIWKVRMGDAHSVSAVAYAYVQGALFELVEVNLNQELLAIHRGWLPESDTEARLNHLAYLVDSQEELDRTRERLEAAGVETAWRANFGDVFTEYFYADTTTQLGHFCEFVCLGPVGRAFPADVPQT